MEDHVYEGIFEDGVYTLKTDGEPEPDNDVRFGWGDASHDDMLRTAIRVVTREVPTRFIAAFAERFVREVLGRLPADRSWRLTSRDVRSWMDAGEMWMERRERMNTPE